MVSICANCKGLQRLRAFDLENQESDAAPIQWMNCTLPSLRRSSAEGCRACALILQGVLLHHDKFAGVREDHVKVRAQSFDSPDPTQHHLSVELRWKQQSCCTGEGHEHDDGYPDLKLEYFTDQDAEAPFPPIGRGRQISEHPLQDWGLASAGAMIRHCLAQHSKCGSSRSSALPKRVLDVSVSPGDSPTTIRLHEPLTDVDGQSIESGQYLTLSYCYGTGQAVLKTTQANRHPLKDGFPLSALPKTFQDAVFLTRALGIRWLWIDSLCIITDSVEDRIEQASKMDGIFGNSFLTIAATSAADASEGLFQPKPPCFKIQAIHNHGSASKVHVREQPSHYSFKAPFDEDSHMNDWELPFNMSDESTQQAPLLKRAWAYVERLLSPRILHFTRSEMILECREGYQCECGRIDDMTFDSRTTDSVKQEYARVVAEADQQKGVMQVNSRGFHSRRNEALQLWSYIITEYTSRDLTYEADRLVSIVGIAKTLSNVLQSGYVAGHWTFSTLGLLWYPNDNTNGHRPQLDSIPTWSWASVEGSPIFFDNATAMDLSCTATFASERDDTPSWSPFAGNALELTAAMATEVTFHSRGNQDFYLLKNGISVSFDPDVLPPAGYCPVANGETLICVWFSMSFRSSIIGLVLQQSTSNPQLHHRVGRFECYECRPESSQQGVAEDAEALFGHWFPEVTDMTRLDTAPHRNFLVA